MSMITVIGRGHSGTRAISQTLYASGVYMGNLLNPSADLVPPGDMYDACRVMAPYVEWQGDLNWNFNQLHTMDIEPEFVRLIEKYLASVLDNKAQHKGWKIPENHAGLPLDSTSVPRYKVYFLDP